MKRSSFLKRLLASLFGAALLSKTTASQPDPDKGSAKQLAPRYLYSGTVAGTYYYDFPSYGPELMAPQADGYDPNEQHLEHEAELRLEPDNAFDHRAIEVLCNKRKMGYMARKDNKIVYNLLKDGNTLKAFVRLRYLHDKELLINYDEWQQLYELRIRVYLHS